VEEGGSEGVTVRRPRKWVRRVEVWAARSARDVDCGMVNISAVARSWRLDTDFGVADSCAVRVGESCHVMVGNFWGVIDKPCGLALSSRFKGKKWTLLLGKTFQLNMYRYKELLEYCGWYHLQHYSIPFP